MRQSNKFIFTIAVVLACSGAANGQKSDNTDDFTAEAKAKTASFAKSLKQALMEAVQSGGFENGVYVCKDQAPAIAARLSTDGWTVARTSLKMRNSDNQADSWEQDMLVAFDRDFKTGKSPTALTATSVDEKQFRYMQAIPTGQLCLACHGQSIDPDLYESIEQAYPNDLAVGYTLKDIRGAFTLKKSLEE